MAGLGVVFLSCSPICNSMLLKITMCICFMALLLTSCGLYAQKAVGDTLSYSIMAGGSLSVPVGEEWLFLSLSYSEGMYGMATQWEGPDTLKPEFTWVAPMWNVESQLLGDGKSTGMYLLKVIKIK